MLRKTGYALVLLLAVLAGLVFNFREEVTRLAAVNTLFSPERIVRNFSHMDEMFLHAAVPLPGPVRALEGESAPLPTRLEGLDVADYLSQTATTSLLVLKDGRIAHESYRLGTRPDDLRISWSVAKSVLSLAVGAAVERGELDLGRTVDSYVPALADGAYAGVTVEQALRMSSGVSFDEVYLDFWSDINRMGRVLALGGSMDGFAAARSERARPAGTVRQYNSIDTHVVAMALRAATGRSLPAVVGETVLGPAGLEGPVHYVTDGEGTAFALGGLNMSTRDYARIGQLVLEGGRVGDRQVVAADWIARSTAASAPEPAAPDGFGYGYQWWVPEEAEGVVLGRGVYGQYLWIDRPRGVVIVKTAANRAFREPGALDRDVRFMDRLAASISAAPAGPRPGS